MVHDRKRLDHLQAEQKYQLFREGAYEVARQEFPDIVVRGITFQDAATADSWKMLDAASARLARGTWDWTKEYSCYQKRPNRFEVSLSRGGLAALCYGQLSKHGTRVRLNLIEATPARPFPLDTQTLPVISIVAAAFADIVGAHELWVIDPAPGIESLYRQQGFGAIEHYHGRRVGQRRIL
jgi:hypothetical protein